MPKEFYTERDIEDMVKRGETSLNISENVVLTELAYEKANRLGMKLLRNQPDNPPSAPIRPYLSQKTTSPVPPIITQNLQSSSTEKDLHTRIREAVITRMGPQIDPDLLDTIIKRVLQSTGAK